MLVISQMRKYRCIMIVKIENTDCVKQLFDGWEETMIWSCLQGVMGEIYANDSTEPSSAVAIIGDICFFAGKANYELVSYNPNNYKKEFLIMVPQDEKWAQLIEQCYDDKATKVFRHATKKEIDVFDKKKLSAVVDTLPNEYTIKMIDEELFYKCKNTQWCTDFVSQYASYDMYKKYGLGVIILKNGEPVSGASSYTSYKNGIEIEVDTNEIYRRRGLAYISASKLILECLKRNLYPSWDAHNKESIALAQKLGYNYSHAYTAYEICEC